MIRLDQRPNQKLIWPEWRPELSDLTELTDLSELTKVTELYELVSRFKVSEVPDRLVWWSKKVEKMKFLLSR